MERLFEFLSLGLTNFKYSIKNTKEFPLKSEILIENLTTQTLSFKKK